jgi:hypothetical protein
MLTPNDGGVAVATRPDRHIVAGATIELIAAVDALIYALAHALGGHNPTQTVGARPQLATGSAIKRVMRACQLGYLGKASKGRSGGLVHGTSAEVARCPPQHDGADPRRVDRSSFGWLAGRRPGAARRVDAGGARGVIDVDVAVVRRPLVAVGGRWRP